MVLHAPSSSSERCTYLEALTRFTVVHKPISSVSSTLTYPTPTNAASRRALRQLARELSQEESAEWDDCSLSTSQHFFHQKCNSFAQQQEDKEKDGELEREWQLIDVTSHETQSHSILTPPAVPATDIELINTNLSRTWDHHEEPIDELDSEAEEDQDEFSVHYDYDGSPIYTSASVLKELELFDYTCMSRRLYEQEVYRRCLQRDWGVPKRLKHRIRQRTVDHQAKLFFQYNPHKITTALTNKRGRVCSKKKTDLHDYPFLNPFDDHLQDHVILDKLSSNKRKQRTQEKKEERRRIARLYKHATQYGRSSEQRSPQQFARYVRAQQLKRKVSMARVQMQRKKMLARKLARDIKRQSARNFTPLPPRKAGVAQRQPYNPNPNAPVTRPAPTPAYTFVPNVQPGKKHEVHDSNILHLSGSFEKLRFQFYQRYKEKLQNCGNGFICTGIRNAPLGSHVKDRFMREMRLRQVDPVLSFHGTRLGNMQSICDRGLLIPGGEGASDIKVAHGTALGKGIYTCQNINYPLSYSANARTLFACAVIADLNKPHVTFTPSNNASFIWPGNAEKDVVVSGEVIVLFKNALVVPLFLIDIWRPEWEGKPEEYREYDEKMHYLSLLADDETNTNRDPKDVQLVDEFIKTQTKVYSDETQSLPYIYRSFIVKLHKQQLTKTKMAGLQLGQKAQTDYQLDGSMSMDETHQE